MSVKQSPKSCRCPACKAGKRTNSGHTALRYYERAFRHRQNQALRCGAEVLSPAPMGNYFD
jgi:hypothetical protein